jgi:hypothetical protein
VFPQQAIMGCIPTPSHKNIFLKFFAQKSYKPYHKYQRTSFIVTLLRRGGGREMKGKRKKIKQHFIC